MFSNLNNILNTFTKTQKQLATFMEKNAAKIEKDRLELEVKEREQEKAAHVSKQIEAFLNVSDT